MKSRIIRIALHVLCALRNGRVAWHWQGIRREFKP